MTCTDNRTSVDYQTLVREIFVVVTQSDVVILYFVTRNWHLHRPRNTPGLFDAFRITTSVHVSMKSTEAISFGIRRVQVYNTAEYTNNRYIGGGVDYFFFYQLFFSTVPSSHSYINYNHSKQTCTKWPMSLRTFKPVNWISQAIARP